MVGTRNWRNIFSIVNLGTESVWFCTWSPWASWTSWPTFLGFKVLNNTVTCKFWYNYGRIGQAVEDGQRSKKVG